MRLFFLALAIAVLTASPAHAMPFVAAAVGAFGAFLASGTIAATIVGTVLKIGLAVGASLLQQMLTPTEREENPGIKKQAGAGGISPQTFIVGRYATPGHFVCPPMTNGTIAQTPNAFLCYVIDLGDMPIKGVRRYILNGEYVEVGDTPNGGGLYPILGAYEGRAWVIEHDGTQTTADAFLLDKFSTSQDRPWQSDMIGYGVPYVVAVFLYDAEVFNAFPELKFEVEGIALYDPRLDTTVGGSGSQRWESPSTWEFTDNVEVIKYNIMRGITLPDGSVWGGKSNAEDVPLSSWFAAMNECDVDIDLDAGGTQKQFKCGLEISVAEEPAGVLEELNKASSAQMAEIGGVWKTRCGPVGMPVYFMTDDDIVITQSQQFSPFPSFSSTFNAIHASAPDPEALWEPQDLPPRYNEDYEAEDDDQQLPANLSLAAVWEPLQAQRLMKAYIEDERRFRRHVLTLPPDAAILEPLDAIEWTSSRNSYTDKVFELTGVDDNLLTVNQQISIRERDSSDYDWSTSDELPLANPVPGIVRTGAITPDDNDFAVIGVTIKDSATNDRRAGIQADWPTGYADVRGVAYQARVVGSGQAVAQAGQFENYADGTNIISGAAILPAENFEVRLKLERGGPGGSDWTSWLPVTTPDVKLGYDDFIAQIETDISDALAAADDAASDASDAADAAAIVQAQLDGIETSVFAEYADWDTFASFTAAVIDDVDEFSAAFLGLSAVTSGGYIAGLKLTSWDDPDGSAGSVFEAIGDQILLSGSVSAKSLTVHDWTNMVPDNQITTSDVWNIDNVIWEIIEKNTDTVDGRSIGEINYIGPYPGTGYSGVSAGPFFRVNAGDELFWSYRVRRGDSVGGTTAYEARANIIWYDEDDVQITNESIGSVVTSASAQNRSGTVTVPSGAITAQWRWSINHNNTDTNINWIRFHSPVLRRRAGTVDIRDGAITADKVTTSELITLSAQIGALTVGTLQIIEDAVTEPEFSFTSGSTSLGTGALDWTNINGPTSTLTQLQSLTFSNPRALPLTIQWGLKIGSAGNGDADNYRVFINKNGSTVYTKVLGRNNDAHEFYQSGTFMDVDLDTGSRTYKMYLGTETGFTVGDPIFTTQVTDKYLGILDYKR